jgi:hypothetical protein
MYGSTDITKAADLMFSRITAPVLTVPFTTTGHTEETPTLTPEKEATAPTKFLFIMLILVWREISSWPSSIQKGKIKWKYKQYSQCQIQKLAR